jgi:hypothetical protein
MKKMILLISVMIVAGGSAHGDDGYFGKILDWDPERELICYGSIYAPLIEADSSGLFIIHRVGGSYRLYEMHSYDNSGTWSDPFDVFERAAWGESMSLEGHNLHVAAQTMPGSGLLYRRTTNAGYSWSDVEMLVENANCGRTSINIWNDEVFCTYNQGADIMLLRSFDNGLSWEQPLRIVDDANLMQSPYLANSDGIWHFVYCSGCANPPYSYEIYYIRSSDDGDTWSEPSLISVHDRYDSQFPNCAADDNGTVAVTWYDYKYGAYQGMWGEILCRISTDYGVNWGPEIRITDDTCSIVSDVSIKDETIYIAYDYNYINRNIADIFLRYSFDLGANWGEIERVSNYTRSSLTTSIAVSQPSYPPDTDMIHIVWQEGIPEDTQECLYYRQKTQEITGIEDDISQLPTQIEILKNYPNPFNAATTIEYSLSCDSDINLSIYNVLGRKIHTLFLGRQQAGNHSIKWDAADYSSGIYFCKLTASNRSFAKRMVLLK